jgi:hypothetical protein
VNVRGGEEKEEAGGPGRKLLTCSRRDFGRDERPTTSTPRISLGAASFPPTSFQVSLNSQRT